jgi:hypothetical protein
MGAAKLAATATLVDAGHVAESGAKMAIAASNDLSARFPTVSPF